MNTDPTQQKYSLNYITVSLFLLNVFCYLHFFSLFQMFTISIIKGCDKIEKKHADLLWECSRLQVEINNESVRNDLHNVEDYIRNLPPVFTAAGFFRLNQRLFSSLSSALVTYVIVIIQFNTVGVGFHNTNFSNLTEAKAK